MSEKSPYYQITFSKGIVIAVTTESLRDTLLNLWLLDRIAMRFPSMKAEGIAALMKELGATGYRLECPPDWMEHSILSGHPNSILPPGYEPQVIFGEPDQASQTTPEAGG